MLLRPLQAEVMFRRPPDDERTDQIQRMESLAARTISESENLLTAVRREVATVRAELAQIRRVIGIPG